jgi:hypothetical protein
VVTADNPATFETRCALGSGLIAENDAGQLANPEAYALYQCMRDPCGSQCGLPSCKVDQAAQLIVNASCDECFAGGCCAPLNACYGDRACKLMFECMINECGNEFWHDLEDQTPPASDNPVLPDICSTTPPKPVAGIPACELACICRYRNNDPGLPPLDPAMIPANLATAVYGCGKGRCASACTPTADGGAR